MSHLAPWPLRKKPLKMDPCASETCRRRLAPVGDFLVIREWTFFTMAQTRWWFQKNKMFTPILGKIPNLTNMVQLGWFNHQPVKCIPKCIRPSKSGCRKSSETWNNHLLCFFNREHSSRKSQLYKINQDDYNKRREHRSGVST